MMGSWPAFAALSLLAFFALKFVFWANAFIFLSAMHRRISKEFWAFTSVELMTSALSSMSFSYAMVFNAHRLLVAIVFVLASLIYLFYMMNRVWRLSSRREGS